MVIEWGGVRWEYEAEAAAGIYVTPGVREPYWWGTLIKYRPQGGRRWRRFNAVDVHPMNVGSVELALRAKLTRDAAAAR